MISRELALALREAGLTWHPESGDRFQLDLAENVEAEVEADVFTVSEMTIEARRYPTGTILAFNGTTEWALDSVALADAVWLPREDQLRELLRATFRSLTRLEDSFEVEVELGERLPARVTLAQCGDGTGHEPARGGERVRFDHPDVAEAYGEALLALVELSR